MDDFGIRVRSLQALGFVLIARPEYMLERDLGKIVEATLSSGSHIRLKVDCLAATALQLLLKLKRHLKIVYSLNDSRCQAFSPTEPPKPGEPLSRQNIPFDINQACTGVPSTHQDLVQRYQEFKGALKEDTVDYSAYTASIKRKRPTPRKLKSGRTMGDDEDDYDDEDWAVGGRRQGSGRKDNSSRGGRHRR